jgi:signal transduction histidine kinase
VIAQPAVANGRRDAASRPSRQLLAGLLLLGTALVTIQILAPFVSWWDEPVDVPRLLADAMSVAAFWFLGLYAFAKRPDNRVGSLMMAVAFAGWLTLVGWINNDLTYTVGVFVLENLWLAILAHLFLAFPTGRLSSRLDRTLVIAVYAWWFASNMIRLSFLDFRANGWAFDNVFLIHPDNALADRLGTINSTVSAGFALVFLYALALHWRRATPTGRHVLFPVVLASLPTAAWVVSRAFADAFQLAPLTDMLDSPIGALATTALPIGFAVGLVRSRLGRSRVGDLIVELGEAPETARVRDTLSRILRDPTLRIAYRLPDSDAYVDESGTVVALPAEPARAVTAIERDGSAIAVLVHDPAVLEDPDLLRSAVAATRLAVENERLQAEVRAQLAEVRASRARIVEAGDAERRRVERNLHDGAQQRLVTLSLGLAHLRDELPDDADPSVRGSIVELHDELRSAIRELRELARGIHPAILSEEGLVPAVESLAERSPVPVSVEGAVDRLPDAVEATAYFVVAEALANVVKYASASRAIVRISPRDGMLEVEVSDDGVGGADTSKGSGLRGLGDRVSAVGGRLWVESPVGAGTTIGVEVPLDGR